MIFVENTNFDRIYIKQPKLNTEIKIFQFPITLDTAESSKPHLINTMLIDHTEFGLPT